jgi:hypothetical protein
MDEKINLKAVAHYSEQCAVRIMDNFFAQKETITGSEILNLCSIKQVNLFVLHELFKAWKGENKKIQSPYFDYSAPPVKEAFETLMSTLSNHISVDRAHFSPLLQRAIGNTLLLILIPYDFFSNLIAPDSGAPLQIDSFKEQLKYLKINKAPLERLLQRFSEKNIQELSGNEAFALLDQILEEVNFTPEDVEAYLEEFSKIIPLSVEKLYESPVKAKEAPKAVNQPKAPLVAQATVTKPTVNDKLARESRPPVAANLQKISRIKDSLTINQKFMFTKVLFHGDFELFSKAIDDIDRFENVDAALRFIDENYMEWDKESEEFHEFMELVEKRFL